MSQLERLAEAIVQVGKQSGPAMAVVDGSQRAAERLAAAVPNDIDGHSRTIRTHLYEASAALRDVARLLADFDKQADSFAKRLVGGPAGNEGPGTGQGTGSPEASADWLSPYEVEMVDVRTLDFGDNPVVGKFARGDLTVGDYDWVVDTWDTVVRPGVQGGMTRGDFDEFDKRSGAVATRRTVDVFDLFLRTEKLRASQQDDGTWVLDHGRHRVTRAMAKGIYYLPVRLFPRPNRPS